MRFLIAWKSLGAEEAERRLASPWAFRDFVNEIRSSTDALQANALLHLIFPDTFEYMIAPSHRQRLTSAFAKAPGVAEAGDDEDRQIQAIREAGTEALGRELELYSEPFHRVWSEDPPPQWTELVLWASVGFRPYLELGGRDDPLRLFCELDGGLLLDVSLGDEEIPDTPPAINDTDWVAFVQANDGYLAEVMIEPSIEFEVLAVKLGDLVDGVAAGERPFLDSW